MSNEACTHDAPKTYYATQGGAQWASPSPRSMGTNGLTPTISHGALCDSCARAAGLSPTAFGRELQS